MPAAGPRTLFAKLWDLHAVETRDDGVTLLYIDRHLVHEVTSPQAFEGLRAAGRPVRRPELALAVADHNVPTEGRVHGIADETARIQVATLEENVQEFGIPYLPLLDSRQGIVHVIGPEQGFTLPGTTVVCGDSHTATHGAFGALAVGIGTSEVEHVLATQTLLQRKPKTMRVTITGDAPVGVDAKDLILSIIGRIGAAGGTGHVIEYAGAAIRALSMEGRMTVCNMSIEAGARAGLIAPDETTFAYLKGRPMAPAGDTWAAACADWRALSTDPGAAFDREVELGVEELKPHVTWGTSPQDAVSIDDVVPDPAAESDPDRREIMERGLAYMDLAPGTPLADVPVDRVFIGSCTNARIEDIRAAATIARGRAVSNHVRAMVVPGSGLVKEQAEAEGLDQVLIEAGFDWREPGCSMCLGMNPDQLEPGERCVSTSNRNFEGRQGRGGRTHLASPATAAASAIVGTIADHRSLARETA